MKNIYINENGLIEKNYPTTGILSAIIVDTTEQRRIKELINEMVSEEFGAENKVSTCMSWKNLNNDNVNSYLRLADIFTKTDALNFEALVISDYNNSKKYNAYFKLIADIYERFEQEDIRVFISTRRYPKTLTFMKEKLAAKGIDCDVEQCILGESRFYQLANVGAGILRYFRNENEYFAHMNEPGVPELVRYFLNSKKPKNKITICKYNEL